MRKLPRQNQSDQLQRALLESQPKVWPQITYESSIARRFMILMKDSQIGSRFIGTKSCMTLRTLHYGIYGIFLIMGNAGLCPSTVAFGHVCKAKVRWNSASGVTRAPIQHLMTYPKPKAPCTPCYRTLGLFWVSKTINKDNLDP